MEIILVIFALGCMALARSAAKASEAMGRASGEPAKTADELEAESGER